VIHDGSNPLKFDMRIFWNLLEIMPTVHSFLGEAQTSIEATAAPEILVTVMLVIIRYESGNNNPACNWQL
jgi:hypothetical protein